MDQFYFEEGYVEASYFGYVANATAGFTPYIAEGYLPSDFFEDRGAFTSLYCDAEIVIGMLLEAQAYLSSLITLDVIAYKLTDSTATLTCEFTQTAIGTRGQDTDLFAFTDAAIAVEVSRIRDNNIATSAVFDVAVDFVVERSADADVDALFSAIISGLRSRDVNLETQAAFSFDVNVQATKVFDSTLSSQSSVSITADRFRNSTIDAIATATTSANGDRFRSSAVNLNLEFTVNATARQIRDAHLTGTGVANITCDAIKTAQASSSQQAQFSQAVLAGTLEIVSANMSVYASVFVSRNAYNRTPVLMNNIPITSESGAKFGVGSVRINFTPARTLSYPNQIRAYIDDQFVVQSWYQGGLFADGTLLFCGAGTSIGNTAVGDNQWAVYLSTRIINLNRYYTFHLLTRNSSNQTVRFSSVEYNTDQLPWIRKQFTNDIDQAAWNLIAVTKDSSNVMRFYINNTVVASGTISSLGTATEYRVGLLGDGGAGNDYWDEFSYRKNTSIIQTGPITNDVDNQIFLFHFEEIGTDVPVDDNSTPVINHSGNAGLTSQFSLLGKLTGISNVSANLQSTVTLSAIIGTLEDIDLIAFSDAAVTTSAVKITDTSSAVSGEFTQLSAANVIASFESAIISQNSLTVINSRLRDVTVSLSTEATTLTVANEFEGATADFSSRFFTAHIYIDDEYLETGYYDEFETNVSKIAAGVANFAVTSTLSVSIRTDVFVAMVVNSSSTVVANVVKSTDVTVLEVSESTLTAEVRKITDITLTSTVVFTVFCNAVTAGEINLVAFSNASLSAIANANKPFDAVLSSQSVLFAETQDSLNSSGQANISSEFSTNIAANYTASAVIITEAVASSLSVVVKSVAVEIPLDCNFTQTVQASRIRPGISNQFAVATTLSEAVKTVDAQSVITAQSTVVVAGTKVVSAVINIQSAGSTLTAVVRIAGLFIECSVVSTVSASGVANKSAGATISSTATFTSATVKLVNASAAIVSSGSLSATIGVRKPFTAAFTSALTFVVAIRDLRLDEIVYVIPGENYVYEIISESRLHGIYGETRIRSVTGESRNRRITGESRIHIID